MRNRRAIASAVDGARAGDQPGGQVRGQLAGLHPEALAQVLIAGLTPGDLRSGGGVRSRAMVTAPDLIVNPLAAEVPALPALSAPPAPPALTGLTGMSALPDSRLPSVVVTVHPGTGRLAALCSRLAGTARGAVWFRTWSSRSHADLRVITRSCQSRANSTCTPRLACTPS